ncbi:MAG: YbaB/EbfC family nucleoid-associated protein, partial [Caldilineaceae bacterium]|nr:YbaB/EbfC family nucleoid-associated protein [Caldilineaceae bacterium]
QEEMEKTQAALAEEELTVTAGGGMVTVIISGAKELRSIKIKPEAVDPDDVEMLEDLIMAAVTEAMKAADDLSEERMGGLTGGLGLPPGLGF